jgi:hypothetical protein
MTARDPQRHGGFGERGGGARSASQHSIEQVREGSEKNRIHRLQSPLSPPPCWSRAGGHTPSRSSEPPIRVAHRDLLPSRSSESLIRGVGAGGGGWKRAPPNSKQHRCLSTTGNGCSTPARGMLFLAHNRRSMASSGIAALEAGSTVPEKVIDTITDITISITVIIAGLEAGSKADGPRKGPWKAGIEAMDGHRCRPQRCGRSSSQPSG